MNWRTSVVCWAAWPLGAVFSAAAMAQAPSPPTVEQLQAELERRDAIIGDLLQRVQALEQRVGTAPAAPPAVPPSTPRAAAASPTVRAASDEAADEALLERALERSLVLAGGALLPRGVRELEPSLGYDYSQRSGVVFVGSGAAFRNFRRENQTAALTFRAGLPWSSQLDVVVPLARQRFQVVLDGIERESTDSGLGDVQVALTHQFLDERRHRVAVLGGLSWVRSNGDASLRPLAAGTPDFLSDASVGAGHDSLVARLTASKRMDPLVFVGQLSHSWSRAGTVEGIDVKAGGVNGLSLRAILAASPDVSVRSGVSFARSGRTRLNGVPLAGTATTASLLELGTSVVLGRNMLLDVALGIGLTSESPDVTFGISLPIRF